VAAIAPASSLGSSGAPKKRPARATHPLPAMSADASCPARVLPLDPQLSRWSASAATSVSSRGQGAATTREVDLPDDRSDLGPQARQARTEALYRAHRSAIAKQIRALIQDDAAIEDLVNETFLRAHKSLPNFDGRSAITTWLHGIAINVARTHVAKLARRRGLDARHADEPQPAGSEAPDEAIAARRAFDRFRAAVQDLPDALREAFVLRVIEQRSWQDTADLLTVPISTLHGRVAKAEQIVRERTRGSGGRDG
jgi:RNA polymerase sigma-70 factor (ECF subfamily)